MPGDTEKPEWARKTFASAIRIKDAAEELLTTDSRFAGPAAALCNQSAERMMYAFCLLHGEDCAGAENTEELWNICIASRKELKATDVAAQTLIACEWADYPDFRRRSDIDYTRDAIGCLRQLERAMLEIVPELAANTEQNMGMGQCHLR